VSIDDVEAELGRRFDLASIQVQGYPEVSLLVREALRASAYTVADDQSIIWPPEHAR
jgi:hypothetical protein